MYQDGRDGLGVLGVFKSHRRRGGLQDVSWFLKSLVYLAVRGHSLALDTACSAERGLRSGLQLSQWPWACLSISLSLRSLSLAGRMLTRNST